MPEIDREKIEKARDAFSLYGGVLTGEPETTCAVNDTIRSLLAAALSAPEPTMPTDEARREALRCIDYRSWGYWTGEHDDLTKRRVTETIRTALSADPLGEMLKRVPESRYVKFYRAFDVWQCKLGHGPTEYGPTPSAALSAALEKAGV